MALKSDDLSLDPTSDIINLKLKGSLPDTPHDSETTACPRPVTGSHIYASRTPAVSLSVSLRLAY